jgi:hypothetical protein
VKFGCSRGHTTFACRDSSCSTWRGVYKRRMKKSENGIKCVWNDLKPWGAIYRVVGDEI